jgi:hypothetical protein
MKQTPSEKAFSLFLPDDTLTYFDVVASSKTATDVTITLEEKNNPPLEKRHEGLSVESKGFKDLTITDFPARGRKTVLTFRRRRWRVGTEILKRDIDLRSPGTLLEREFGLFLKTDS